MTPSFPSVILIRSMKRTDSKIGNSNEKTNPSLKEGFWCEFLSAWKWLNVLALPAALVFVSIMIVVEAVNSNPVAGIVLGLMTITLAEIACAVMAISIQVMLSIFDWIDK